MSVPRFYVAELPAAGVIALDQQEARHASQVLRLTAGDTVELFDGRGGSAVGTIALAGKRGIDVHIGEREDIDRELPCPIELLVALPKGDRQKQLIDALVQLGVHRLTPLATRRSVAQPVAAALDRLKRGVIESSKQCGRNQLLEVGEPITLETLLSEQPQASSAQLRCFAHPYGNPPSLASISSGLPSSAQLIVGPEGGLTDEECAALTEAGWLQVSLGTRILRVEMAATAIAAWWSIQAAVAVKV